jgi:hypothetical protein
LLNRFYPSDFSLFVKNSEKAESGRIKVEALQMNMGIT